MLFVQHHGGLPERPAVAAGQRRWPRRGAVAPILRPTRREMVPLRMMVYTHKPRIVGIQASDVADIVDRPVSVGQRHERKQASRNRIGYGCTLRLGWDKNGTHRRRRLTESLIGNEEEGPVALYGSAEAATELIAIERILRP